VSQLLNNLIQEDLVIREYNFADNETRKVIRKVIRLAFVKNTRILRINILNLINFSQPSNNIIYNIYYIQCPYLI
jgi:hypothetical protein